LEKEELQKKLIIAALQILLERQMITHEEYIMAKSIIKNGR
jgi:uncharacterized protein YqgQ